MSTHRPRSPKSALALALTLAWGVAASPQAQAATCVFNPATGNWALGANWSCTIVPGVNDDATIGIGKAVTIDTAQSVRNLGNAGSVNIDAFLLTLSGSGGTTNTGTLNVGSGVTAALQVSAGHNVNNTGGVINIGNGSVLNQFGSTFTGGTINTSGSGALVASTSTNNFLTGVTLGGRLDLATGANARERITNGLTFANGAAHVANGGILMANGGLQTFGGAGTIHLDDAGARFALEGSGTTTIGANVVVRGQGNIGQALLAGGTNHLANSGRVSADVDATTLTIVAGASSGTVINTGLIDARNGGTLTFAGVTVNNAGGVIDAQNGSVVQQSGATLSGGTLSSAGTGVIRASTSSVNFLDNVTLSGVLDMSTIANSRDRVSNGMTFAGGAVNIANGGVLSVNGGTQTIDGSGTIHLNDGAARLALEGNGTTTIGSNILVRGHGNIGQALLAGGTNHLVNNGRIVADVAGATLNIVPGASSGNVTNNGFLEAANGGTLLLSANVIGNPAGQILAGAGSSVVQNGATISGNINTSGSGLFSANTSLNNFLDSVTLNGTLDLTSIANSRERTLNGLTFAGGSIDIANGGVLSINGGAQLIGGNGTINLDDGGARLALEGNGTTTLGPSVVVRGHGNIGQALIAGGTNVLVNDGRISADVGGGTLTLVPGASSGGVVNRSLLDARNGGTLQLSGLTLDNSAGVIDAKDASVVLHNASTISGGTLSSAGSGVFRANTSSNNFLDNVTIAGVVDMTSIGNSRERVINGVTFAGGRIDIGNGGILSANGGSVTYGGSGTINLNDAGARFAQEGNGTTTIGANVVLRGQGNIGQALLAGGTNHLVNLGTIVGDGGTLAIVRGASSGNFTNSGLLHASGGTVNLLLPLLGAGTLMISGSGQMNLSGTGVNNTGTLTHNGVNAGSLNLGPQHLVVSSDYTNANSGTGNTFDRRANVTGAGQIRAAGDVAQAITGAQVSNGNTPNASLTIGNVRVGATTFNYQIGNAGTTGPTLRGALQTSVNGGNLSDARLSGSGVTAANYNAGAPGGNSGNLDVVFTVANAGALAPLSGQVINLRSNFENIADQKLNLVLGSGAAAYNAAVGSATSPVSVANQRVGGSNSANVVVANTAPAGSFSEDLNVALGALAGPVSASGSISGRLAGSNNTGSGNITVGVDSASAGAKTGTVTLNYQTAGAVAGVSNGLAPASVGSQAVTVNGNVYLSASGQLISAPLNFGTVQVGQGVSRDLVVRNSAGGPAGFVEDLNVSFGATSGTGASLISGSGSFSGIAAGNNSSGANGTMTVSVNTSAPGTVAGGIALNYITAGAVGGVGNGLAPVQVGSETFGVSGVIETVANVINRANPVLNTPSIVLPAIRVGDAAPGAFVSVTNQATAPPQAALNASITSNGAPVTASGAFNLLAPGQTNNTSLRVGLANNVAGNFTGANAGLATIALVSDANNVGNCAPECQVTLASQQVSVSGKVYTPAIGQVGTTVVDFGVVRIGDTPAARQITVHNTAAATALNDTLRATLGGVGAPFGGSGTVGNVGPQGSGQISVTLDTANPGIYTPTGSVVLLSQNNDMADASAGVSVDVLLRAQVNRYANADFDLLAGGATLTQSGSDYLLDLGTLRIGQSGAWSLQIDNDVLGPADLLRGGFDLGGVDDFALAGWNAVAALEAGQAQGGLAVSFDATRIGDFEDAVRFDGFGFNDSDLTGIAQQRRLIIRAQVIDDNGGPLPEPSALTLLLVAAAGALLARRRARRRH